MIGLLPTALSVLGKDYPIRSDFRIALLIFQAYGDANLSDYEKAMICVRCLFKTVPEDIGAALKEATRFLDGGTMFQAKPKSIKLLDWEQDECLIFSAINRVAGAEIRLQKYVHWWTFLGFFSEIGEGPLSTVVSIRSKKSKGKKLEKWEREFYLEHRDMIDLKVKYSDEDQKEIDRLNALLE